MVDILEALDECAGYEPQGRELRALQPHLQIVLGHQQRHSALVMIGECDLLPIRADLSRLQTLHHVFKQLMKDGDHKIRPKNLESSTEIQKCTCRSCLVSIIHNSKQALLYIEFWTWN